MLSFWIMQILSSVLSSVEKIQALLVFERWVCTVGKPNVLECTVAFRGVAQRVIYPMNIQHSYIPDL